MKNLSLILAILILTGCQSILKEYHCEKDKNYIKVDNELYQSYVNDINNNNVKSYFFDLYDSCALDSCFNNYDLDFWELNLNTIKYNGIYKIYVSDNYNSNCYFKNGSSDKNCYIIEKINKPISKYHIISKKIDNTIEKKVFDSSKNKDIIKYSVQLYKINNSFSGSNLTGFCDNNDLYSKYYKFPKIQKK